MQILLVALYIYLGLGFVYAFYVTFHGAGSWYLFPINVIAGPIVAFIVIVRTLMGKKFHV